MGKDRRTPMFFGVLLLAGLLAGCAGRSLIVSPPPWYALESGLYDAGGAKLFYGIGQAAGVQNLTLLRATADNRAREALAGVLTNYVNELAHSAALTPNPAWAALSVDDQQQFLGMLVRNCLLQAVVGDHWSDPQDPRLLALCRLNLTTFKQVLSDYSSLEEKMRATMWAEAERVHARLSQKF